MGDRQHGDSRLHSACGQNRQPDRTAGDDPAHATVRAAAGPVRPVPARRKEGGRREIDSCHRLTARSTFASRARTRHLRSGESKGGSSPQVSA